MRKSGPLRGLSAAIKLTQIAQAYLRSRAEPLESITYYDLGSIRSKIIVI